MREYAITVAAAVAVVLVAYAALTLITAWSVDQRFWVSIGCGMVVAATSGRWLPPSR